MEIQIIELLLSRTHVHMPLLVKKTSLDHQCHCQTILWQSGEKVPTYIQSELLFLYACCLLPSRPALLWRAWLHLLKDLPTGIGEALPKPLLLQAEEAPLSQPLLTGQVLQLHLDHLPLKLLHFIDVFLQLGGQKKDAVF